MRSACALIGRAAGPVLDGVREHRVASSPATDVHAVLQLLAREGEKVGRAGTVGTKMNSRFQREATLAQPWAVVWGAVAIVAAWFLRDVLILVFASILLAVVLRGTAVRLRRYTRLPTGASLALTLALIIGTVAVLATWQGPRVTEEVEILRRDLPVAFEELKARITGSEAAQRLIDELPSRDEVVGDGTEIVARAQAAAATTVGVLAAIGLWLFIAVLLSVSPRTYVAGVLAVVPQRYERRVRRLMGELSSTLWWWSLGRLVSMTFVGIATGAGLALLGIPLALLLGLIAALLTFVPNIGPLLAAVPAVLLALADDPIKALWVAALYAGIQAVEGLLLDPIIDRKTVHLPPALTVTMQIVMGLLVGLAGVALAAPLTAAGMVVVSVLWVQGVLGKPGMPSRRTKRS